MIREATAADAPKIARLGAEMHAESVFSKRVYDMEKCTDRAMDYILSPGRFLWVAESNRKATGFLAGYMAQYHFGPEWFACLLDFYMRPDARGSRDSIRLLKQFEEWAAEREAVEVNLGISTGVRMDEFDRLATKLGYTRVGGIYKRDCNV